LAGGRDIVTQGQLEVYRTARTQSDLLFTGEVFVCGLLLGWLRWISGSTILTTALHGLINCERTFEAFTVFNY
jgi:membrane protease YdiL (CAAX protease family)